MSEPVKSPFDAMLDAFRQVVREEIAAALAECRSQKLLYTTKKAAAMLGVEEFWLATRARAGLVRHHMLGRYRRFSREDIDAVKLFLDEPTECAEGEPVVDSEKPTEGGTVKTYLIHSALRNAVKIGYSKSPERRLSSLRSGAGEKLTILTLIEGNCEKELQQRFSHLCVIGEWFEFGSEIQEFLEGRLTASNS